MQPTSALSLLALLTAAALAEDTKPAAAPAAAKEKAHPSSLDALFKLVDIGRTHLGVRYPVMDKGVMSSMITSERMTRLDENRLQFEDAIIDQRATDPLKFILQRAEYNRQSDQLLSNQPSRIESKTYQIEGDSMTYDRKTSVARLDGRVRMIVYEASAPAKPVAKDAAPTPVPAPAAPQK